MAPQIRVFESVWALDIPAPCPVKLEWDVSVVHNHAKKERSRYLAFIEQGDTAVNSARYTIAAHDFSFCLLLN